MKASKGQTVYQVRSWNGFNQCCVEKIIIKSWGKKQATAVNFKTGKLLHDCIYLNDGDNDKIFSTRKEAVAKGMEINHSLIDNELQNLSDRADRTIKHGGFVSDHILDKLVDYVKNGLHVVDFNEALEGMKH